MHFQTWLDSLPIGGVFVAFAIATLITYECGYRLGHWWQRGTPDEREGPTNMIVGSLLALMAFLLATSMNMASDRFDTRRKLVLAEANAVGTAYLRAGFLPEPASTEIRNRLREYVPLRVAVYDFAELEARIARAIEIQAEIWTRAEALARANPESDVLGLFIESLNEVIDLHETRVTAGLYARVPETIVILLLLGSTATLSMVGYNAGLTCRRSLITAGVLIVVLGAVTTLVIDLDRPRDGSITVSQQPLLDLQKQMGIRLAGPSE